MGDGASCYVQVRLMRRPACPRFCPERVGATGQKDAAAAAARALEHHSAQRLFARMQRNSLSFRGLYKLV